VGRGGIRVRVVVRSDLFGVGQIKGWIRRMGYAEAWAWMRICKYGKGFEGAEFDILVRNLIRFWH
jgi:hypothetical protein